MTLRDRIARAVYESGQAYEGQSEAYPPWDDIRPEEYLFYADVILALPELRAIAAGKPLWVECAACGGSGFAPPDEYMNCPACDALGFVPVDEP